jgi:flagellar export protein FliJ
MAKLGSLIRLKKHELDQYRQALTALQDKLARQQEEKDALLRQLEAEKNLAAVDIDAARNFNAYLQRSLEQLKDMERAIHQTTEDIYAARRVVQEGYLELKKIEITEERRAEAEAAVIAKKDADQLDEVGLNSFRRHHADEGTES